MAEAGYYEERLAGAALKRCYAVAPERVRQYLRAEIDFVAGRLRADDVVLVLGCGYGREIPALAAVAAVVVGIDTSAASLALARDRLAGLRTCVLARMDAADLAFVDASFDAVVAVQNGISAFHVELPALLAEAVRVTRPGGRVLLSTYSERFWEHRLEWFERQAEAGLIGALDRTRTGDGAIVCHDGFTARTVGPDHLSRALAAARLVDQTGLDVVEVDASSLFYVLTVGEAGRDEGSGRE